MRKNIYGLLLVLMLFAASLADAALLAMPEIPMALPDAVRRPLIKKLKPLEERELTLIAEADKNRMMCTNIVEESEQHRNCLDMQKDFNARVEILRTELEQLSDEIYAAITAEIKRLQARDAELTRSIDNDITAINVLGFARRAEDFEEWVKLADSAQKQYENEWKSQLGDVIIAEAQKKMLDLFKGMDSSRLKRLIEKLEKKNDPSKQATLNALRELLAAKAGAREILADRAAAVATGIDRGLQGARIEKREDELRLWLDYLCEAAETTKLLKGCNILKAEMLTTVAAAYSAVAGRVATHEVERLTGMTEEQLGALKKINELLVKHVKERNEVRAAIKALEQS